MYREGEKNMYGEGSFAEGYAIGRDTTNGNNNSNGMWGDSAWWIIILLIFGWFGGWGNGGFGGGFGGNGGNGMATGYDLGKLATTNDVASGFSTSTIMSNQRDLQLGQAGIQQTLCQGFGGVNTSILTSANTTQSAIADLGYQLQSCCCNIREAISGVNYNMATNTCNILNAINSGTRDIIDSQKEGTQAILSYLSMQELAQTRAERDAAVSALSQQNQTTSIVNALRPTPVPAYITCSPYVSSYGLYSGNNGCSGCNF